MARFLGQSKTGAATEFVSAVGVSLKRVGLSRESQHTSFAKAEHARPPLLADVFVSPSPSPNQLASSCLSRSQKEAKRTPRKSHPKLKCTFAHYKAIEPPMERGNNRSVGPTF